MLCTEVDGLKNALEKKNKEVAELNRKMHEIEDMNQAIGNLQNKISKLVHENTGMEE